MRLGEWDIPAPASDPATWDTLLRDVIGCATPIREALAEAGVTDAQVLQRCESLIAGAVLARCWRDVRPAVMRDDRLYIPVDIARRHGLDLALMRKALKLDNDRGCDGDARDGSCDCANSPNTGMRVVLPALRETIRELVMRTEGLLHQDVTLPDGLHKRLLRMRAEALADLRLIRRRRYDTLTRRPKSNAIDRLLASVSARWSG